MAGEYSWQRNDWPIVAGDLLMDLRQRLALDQPVASCPRPPRDPHLCERTVTEYRYLTQIRGGALTEFSYVCTEERYGTGFSEGRRRSRAAVPHDRPLLLPTAAPRQKRTRLSAREGWMLAVPAIALAVIATMLATRPAETRGAEKASKGVSVVLEDAGPRTSIVPGGQMRAAALAPPTPARGKPVGAKAITPTASEEPSAAGAAIAIDASPAPRQDAQAATARALVTGAIEPWSDNGREGYVIVGPPEMREGARCRQVTIVAKGDAQGSAVDQVQCLASQ